MNHPKTTITGVITIIFAGAGFFLGKLDYTTASGMIIGAIGLIFAADGAKII